MKKTLKREVGVALLVALSGLAIYAMLPDDPALVAARAAVVAALAIPFTGFAAAAYGMDWVTKQTDFGGPPGLLEPAPYQSTTEVPGDDRLG